MPVFQAYNKRIGAWVKYKHTKGKLARIMNVKQGKPNVPFKGIRKKQRSGDKKG